VVAKPFDPVPCNSKLFAAKDADVAFPINTEAVNAKLAVATVIDPVCSGNMDALIQSVFKVCTV